MIEWYIKNPNNVLYETVMDAVVKANEPIFRGGEFMCKALDELYKDAIDERVRELAEARVNEFINNELAKAQDNAELANNKLAEVQANLLAKDNEIAQLKAQLLELQKKQVAN
jgi:hypothetical protein